MKTTDGGAIARYAATIPAPLRLMLACALVLLCTFSAVRVLLIWIYAERIAALGAWSELLLIGVRVDLIAIGWALAVPVLLLPLCAARSGTLLWARIARIWFALVLVLVVLLEVASPGFLAEYEVRPNRLFIDYLDRPQEVLPMLWGGFRASLLIGVALTVVAGIAAWRYLRVPPARAAAHPKLLLLWPVLIAVCVLMIRSSLAHRPANPALFARWDDSLVNEVALNGLFTLGHAAYAMRHEADVAEKYGALSDDELLLRLRDDPRFRAGTAAYPTWREQAPSVSRGHLLNLIVIVQESFGAGFSKALGGRDLAPRLDEWSKRGWWFRQLYATGTRSARGLEAIVAGFPPSPAQSVLKLPGAQTGFTTLASVLAEEGFYNEFIYGGESHFDNMRGFFLGNGFNAVIDQKDYPDPLFRGSWGVSDEDLLNRLHARASALSRNREPYFLLAFTSSNHTPFEYPDGHIEPVGERADTVENAVRFADHALGKYLDVAASADYFRNTLILVVADHDVRVYGDDIIPLERFRIPGLLLGAGVVPKQIDSIASQIDLAPTLLSVMGVTAHIPFPGRDLTTVLPEFGIHDGPTPRALMQFNDRFACLEPGMLRVLLPGGSVRSYRVQADGSQTVADQGHPEAREHLLTEVHLPVWLYENGGYRRPQ